MKKLFAAITAAALLQGCSSSNLDYVKERGEARWREYGMEPIAYEGYQWGAVVPWSTTYGGAKVWWRLKAVPDNGITYSGHLQRWGDELHIYGPVAIDAIRPQP